ncbi:MerR family transcriptional regulator [Ferrimonas marina]|uniref:DNA-binding transcriptional regulator, MerR family n=1 Tax=Ferrimonas marina TaxID=299255 RepID=A0A1M5MRS8_9GAMM|nr:MerR family transcriptional regulator [Ferrimonas marina]SHG79926.1 DNA-binding transcriptional regulator, MerR family [Ferrimonas marina]
MKISELCKRTGLSKDGIRHYEQLGLIHSQRQPAGTRFYQDYDEDSLERIEIIQCGKSCGFTLKEIKNIFDCSETDALTLTELRPFLLEKLGELEQRAQEIERMKAIIQRNLADEGC